MSSPIKTQVKTDSEPNKSGNEVGPEVTNSSCSAEKIESSNTVSKTNGEDKLFEKTKANEDESCSSKPESINIVLVESNDIGREERSEVEPPHANGEPTNEVSDTDPSALELLNAIASITGIEDSEKGSEDNFQMRNSPSRPVERSNSRDSVDRGNIFETIMNDIENEDNLSVFNEVEKNVSVRDISKAIIESNRMNISDDTMEKEKNKQGSSDKKDDKTNESVESNHRVGEDTVESKKEEITTLSVTKSEKGDETVNDCENKIKHNSKPVVSSPNGEDNVTRKVNMETGVQLRHVNATVAETSVIGSDKTSDNDSEVPISEKETKFDSEHQAEKPIGIETKDESKHNDKTVKDSKDKDSFNNKESEPMNAEQDSYNVVSKGSNQGSVSVKFSRNPARLGDGVEDEIKIRSKPKEEAQFRVVSKESGSNNTLSVKMNSDSEPRNAEQNSYNIVSKGSNTGSVSEKISRNPAKLGGGGDEIKIGSKPKEELQFRVVKAPVTANPFEINEEIKEEDMPIIEVIDPDAKKVSLLKQIFYRISLFVCHKTRFISMLVLWWQIKDW